jgi:hypothetical protein
MLLVVICYVSAPTTDRAKTGRLSFDTAALLAAYSGWSDERIPEEREAHIEGCATGRSA